MRVVSGTARGLKLESIEGLDTRPTLDNVKEAVFSMLFDKVHDANVLDLFAGSGALGIEALSRGSASCVFCDKSDKSVAVIKKNCEKARVSEKSIILKNDFKECLSYLESKKEKFDIIFLDPPYADGFLDEALNMIFDLSLLSPGGVAVAEFDSGTDVDIQHYNLLKDKKYGRVCINILEAQ